ncbi:MAG: ATP-dependent Clp protease adapter ClpS [Corynebacterium sp.]|nr:ATP-dependent Clp protease adapter ClpS [Corynebacterium sp.]
MNSAFPDLEEAVDTAQDTAADTPWQCIVWDDPVNLMSYVTHVFRTVLGMPFEKAQQTMLEVHTKGKAVVASGERDKCELLAKKLGTWGLWATIKQG